MNLFKHYSISLIVTLFFTSFSLLASDSSDEFAVARILNIGQGSSNVVSFIDKTGEEQHIVFDCGSSGFESTANNLTKISGKSYAPDLDNHLLNYREMLGKSKLNIFAVIFSHPDLDHVNKILKFLPKDQPIQHIICPGTAEKYNHVKLEDHAVRDWLIERFNDGTSIYFPAYGYESLKDTNELSNYFAGQKPNVKSRYTPYAYVDDESSIEYKNNDFKNHPFSKFTKDLHELNETIRVSFLDVNPTHSSVGDRPSKVDPNDDSLVIKVSYGESSILFPGDATGKVTDRIQQNYKTEDKKHHGMHATFNVVAHHGSKTKGSNTPQVIDLIGAKVHLVSAGTVYTHPTHETLKNLENSSATLESTTQHTVNVDGKNLNKQETNKEIYSTFNHGSFTMKLYKSNEQNSIESLSAEFSKDSLLRKTNNDDYKLKPINTGKTNNLNSNSNNNNLNNPTTNSSANNDSSSSSSSEDDNSDDNRGTKRARSPSSSSSPDSSENKVSGSSSSDDQKANISKDKIKKQIKKSSQGSVKKKIKTNNNNGRVKKKTIKRGDNLWHVKKTTQKDSDDEDGSGEFRA